jgi:hypothetical protein
MGYLAVICCEVSAPADDLHGDSVPVCGWNEKNWEFAGFFKVILCDAKCGVWDKFHV